MKEKLLNLKRLRGLLLLAVMCIIGAGTAWGDTYEQLTSIANIDESAQYVLGIDGTGFHYDGTSSWGKTALPTAQTPIYYTLTKAADGNSFTAQATIGETTYYLQVPTSNTFSMATEAGTNTDLIIGTTQVSDANYAVANKTTTARHLRINGTSGLRSYAGTTGTMAFFYKVVTDGAVNTTTAINVPTDFNTDVHTSTTAGQLTATVTANGSAISGATVSWESSNENVATIDESGNVTLVAEGTTIITATYEGVSGEYNESYATYTLTVTDSSPFEGGDVTFVAGTDMGTTSANNSPDVVTKSGVTMSSTDAAFATSEYRLYANSTTTFSTTSGKITKIVFTKTGSYSVDNLSTETGSYNGGTWTGSATSVVFSASAQVRLSQVVVTITPEGTVAPPTISGTTPFLGETTITITADDEATIYYTTDGTDPTTSSAQYSAPFTITATTTVKAIAVLESNTSEIVTEVFTLSTPLTVAEALEATPASGTSDVVYVQGIVSSFFGENTGITGDSSHRYYISDDGSTTDQLLVYKGKGLNNVAFSSDDDLQIGDVVVIQGKLTTYNDTKEIAQDNYIVSLNRPEHEKYTLTIGTLENIDLYIFDDPNGSETLTTGAQIPWGTTIYVSPDPATGYVLDAINVTDADNNNIDVTEGDAGMWTFIMPESNVTITATVALAPATDAYELFSGDLVEGDYIIYYNGKAMKNTVASNRLQYAEVTPEDDVINTADAAIVWHIAKSGDYWTIYSADAEAFAASTGAKNAAQMLADGTDDKALWIVTLDEEAGETYEFVNKKNTENEVNANLRNNSTYGFACYGTSTGGALSLYKKVTAVEVTISAAGAVSFSSKYALDFSESGLTANIVTEKDGSSFKSQTVTVVPAETGLVVEGEEGTYQIPVAAADATFDDVEDNLLVSTASEAYTVTSDDYGFVYGLFKSASTGKVGFQKKKVDFTFGTGKSYLRLPATSGAKGLEFIYLNEIVTGIKTVGNEQMNGDRYNLNGLRVDKNYKGVVIENGKKMINK
ncbi:MAG: chitobiase/beta-hexosaminidase C-terminal domain-containing protein [Prevotella sp.]|nr:chitobiase/beta-hexosaminidase C-terminal domain-containing protein [Prevotella sp.]